MAAPYDLAVNVVAVALGGIGVAGWNRARLWWKYRAKKRFWGFFEQPTVFVVGELESSILMNALYAELESLVSPEADRRALVNGIIAHVRDQEDSGLIGRGDFDAMINLVVLWASLKQTRPLIMLPADLGDHKADNLVLIGGADVNSLTAALSPQLGCQLEATRDSENHNLVKDWRLGQNYPVRTEISANGHAGEVQLRDWGVLVRGRNPHNPKSVVLIVAGAHGLGTFAATEVCVRDSNQSRLFAENKQHRESFEALISYERLIGGPFDGRVTVAFELVRELRPAP